MEINKIFIKEEELDRKIFRIIPFDRFMDCIVNEVNVLVRPSMWEDPFENLLSNKDKSLEKYFTFAQCWSFSKENDLLWRNYSQNSDGIRIQSTPRKIQNSILQSKKIQQISNNPELIESIPQLDIFLYETLEVFLGKVKYLTYENISELLNEIVSKKKSKQYFTPLFIKREAFKNEEEFRIGINYCFNVDPIFLYLSENFYTYDIKANEVFEEVVFDPRISKYKFEGLKNQIEKFGFQNPILKSNLYDKPNIDDIIS